MLLNTLRKLGNISALQSGLLRHVLCPSFPKSILLGGWAASRAQCFCYSSKTSSWQFSPATTAVEDGDGRPQGFSGPLGCAWGIHNSLGGWKSSAICSILSGDGATGGRAQVMPEGSGFIEIIRVGSALAGAGGGMAVAAWRV